jgi:heptose I phosphotransferase
MKLFLAAPFDTLWRDRDPFAAVEELRGPVFRQLEGRRTFRSEIADRAYFVKIHHGVGWGEILKNLLSGRLPILGAGNEWHAIRRLTELGIGTMTAVAYGERGANPARRHSFLITEELAPCVSLEDHCRDWATRPPRPAWKRALIARVGDMAGRMHRGGVNHRDFYLCHFLLHLDSNPDLPKLSIIDLHRAQIRPRTPRRWRDKDLAGLYFSAMDIGLTRRDGLRFLAAYFRRPLRDILRDEAPLLRHLEREGRRLRQRFLRKHAPRTMDLAELARVSDPRLRDRGWVAELSRQLAAATRVMHAHRFAHNDLKWRNLLVDDQRRLYLIDCPAGKTWWGPFLRHRIVKDLACLDKVAKYQLSRTRRLRFYLDYLGKPRLEAADKKQLRHILRYFEGRE